MAWMLPTATLAAPLVADIFGGKDPKTYSPWEQADAMFKANPNLYNYFGNTQYISDTRGTPSLKDDKRTVVNTMSPEMTALADRMMGMAGRGQQTFTSGGMGSLLQDRVNSTVGESTQPNYNRSGYGFNQGSGPVQTSEAPESNYNPEAYTDIMDALRANYVGDGGYGGGTQQQQRNWR
jgi:hypothetical protein